MPYQLKKKDRKRKRKRRSSRNRFSFPQLKEKEMKKKAISLFHWLPLTPSLICVFFYSFLKRRKHKRRKRKSLQRPVEACQDSFSSLTDGILFLLDHEKLMKENVNRPEEMKCSWQVNPLSPEVSIITHGCTDTSTTWALSLCLGP